MDVEFILPGLIEITDKKTGTRKYKIPGGTISVEAGLPLAPAFSIPLALPPKLKIDKIDILKDDTKLVDGVEPTIHIPHAITPNGTKPMKYQKRPVAGFYPEKLYRFNQNQLSDGNTEGNLVLWPVQIDEKKNECRIHKHIKFRIHFHFKPLSEDEKAALVPKIIQKGRKRFGHELKLAKGIRSHKQSILASSTKGNAYSRALMVEENGSNEFTLTAMSHWFGKDAKGPKHNVYGIQVYREKGKQGDLATPDSSGNLAELKSRIHDRLARTYGNVQDVTRNADLLDVIESEWAGAPGIVLFAKNDKECAMPATPLASYLNWPIIGIDEQSDLSRLNKLFNNLGSNQFIVVGNHDRLFDTFVGSKETTRLRNPKEISQYFSLLKYQDPDFRGLYESSTESFYKRAINKDYVAQKNTDAATSFTPGDYIVLYSTKSTDDDIDYSDAAMDLATYRATTPEDVTGQSVTQIRQIIKSHGPSYVALMGDGDSGEVECYYIDDPVADQNNFFGWDWWFFDDDDIVEPGAGSSGNGIIPSDFYYEPSVDIAVGELPGIISSWSWDPKYVIGRVVGTSKANVESYVENVKSYESGLFPNFNSERAIVGSYQESWDDTPLTIAASFVSGGGVNTVSKLFDPESDNYTGLDFDSSEYLNQVNNGICASYLSSHGNYNFIDSPIENGYIYYTALQLINGQSPFIQFTDACLCGLFLGENKTLMGEAGEWAPDEEECIGVGFISHGAISSIAATMISYSGYLEEIAKDFFSNKLIQSNFTVGKSLAYARRDWYSNQIWHSNMDKKTVWETILIGDPAVNIQMGDEQPPNPNQDYSLSYPRVSPESGNTSDTYTFRIDYHDPDEDAPTVKQLVLDGDNYYNLTLESGSPFSGTYACSTSGLSEDPHSFYFHFENAVNGAKNSGTENGPVVSDGGGGSGNSGRDVGVSNFSLNSTHVVPGASIESVSYTHLRAHET